MEHVDVETGIIEPITIVEQEQHDIIKEENNKKESIKDIIDCPICFEDDKDMVALTCPKHHMFCRDCINRHFNNLYMNNQSLACPLCRFEMLSNTDTEYISVRNSLLQVLKQRMMIQNLQIEYNAHRTSNAMRLPRYVSVQTNSKWDRTLLICILLALVIAFVATISVVLNKM
jgi:hypothetical protein